MERYFFVAYAFSGNNVHGNGSTTVITYDKYLNRKQFVESAKDTDGFNSVAITNIIELTESDYKDYIK